MIRSVLFVCLGNICRSPIAEGIAKKFLSQKYHDENFKIESAGTSSWHIGEAPCKDSITIALNHQVDISQQRAQQINKEMLEDFDMIIALDSSNYHDIKKIDNLNLYKLGDFCDNGADVPDPYFFKGSSKMDGFEKVYKMIERNVEALIEKHF